ELIAPVLQQADLRLAQCERVYSENGGVEPQFVYGPGGNHGRQHPRMAAIWKAAGIDIVSLAGNHEEEACAPAIIEHNGVRVAFLSYCSVLRDGQAAGPGKPGVAPARAHT